MQTQDLFIGGVVALFGAALVVGAAQGRNWLLERRAAKALTGRLGPSTARAMLGLAGLALIALGIALASGWRLNWL
jgi:hypothetical protein